MGHHGAGGLGSITVELRLQVVIEKGGAEPHVMSVPPSAVWQQGGHDALAGEYRGIDAVLGMFGKEFELSGGDIKAELVDVYANDTRTVAIEHLVAHRNGKTLEQLFPIVFDGEGGKAREVWVYPFGDDERSADFWS